MKKSFPLLLAAVCIMLSASNCDKDAYRLYRDSEGRTISLIGAWGLTEKQYWTAAVMERESVQPRSLMEFMPDGRGRTLVINDDGSREPVATFRYEKYPASVTIYTEEEYEQDRWLSEDDDQYRRGRTYYFKVVDENTISSREPVSSGTYIVNVFSRF